MGLIILLRCISGLYSGVVNGFERQVWLAGFNMLMATARFVGVLAVFELVVMTPTHFFAYQLAVTAAEVLLIAVMTYRLLSARSAHVAFRSGWFALRGVVGFSANIAFTAGVWVQLTRTCVCSVGPSAWRLGSACAQATTNNESAGKHKSTRTRKGNPNVRRLLCEFAQAAAKTRCALQAKFQSTVVRRGRKRSIIALAHKILRKLFFMLSRREPYRDEATDYEGLVVERNAPRWIKALTKFGFIPVTNCPFASRRLFLTHSGQSCYCSFCKFRFVPLAGMFAGRRHDAMTLRKGYAHHGNTCRN
jgi:hypothetical protein